MDELRQLLDVDFMKLIYDDKEVSIVDCFVMHEGINRNKCNIPRDVIIKALPSLANKPLWGIPNSSFFKSSSTDFIEHARTKEQTENILIFGTFPESGVKNAEFVEMNGKTYLKVRAVLFKAYSPIAMSIIQSKGGNTKISIEIKVAGTQGKDGILNVESMVFLSATCLGDIVKEGIEGSKIDVVRFSLDETIEKFNEHYLKFTEEEKYKIPDNVKENAKKALQLRKESGRGGTSEGVSIASFLIDNDYVTYEKIKYISSYLSRHVGDSSDSSSISSSYISWNLVGGDNAIDWTRKIIEQKKKFNIEDVNNVSDSIEKFIAKELVGTKKAIKVNKSKEAISDSPWGEEDKSKLKKDCLMALNYKSLCKDVFLICDKEYIEGLEGALGYPVMEIKGDEAVYNRNGLASAKAYATKNNEVGVLSELKKIYHKLGLDDGEKNKDGEKMNKEIDNAKVDEEEIDNAKVDEKEIDNAKVDEKEIDNAKVEEEIDNAKIEEEIDNAKVEEMCGKYAELEKECMALKEKIKTFERKEEVVKMAELFADFAHCYSSEEASVIKNSLDKMTYAELDDKISNKAKEFAKNMKSEEKSEDKAEEKAETKDEEKKEEKVENTLKFSVSPFGVTQPSFNFSVKEDSTLDSIIKNSNVKVNK